MPRAKISEFSTTAGDNTDIDGINIAEGCAPSGINDAIRELMAQLKDFQSGAAGDNITVVGTLAAKGTSASGADLKLYEDTDNGTNYVGFMAPASIASNVQWTLPSADGTANQVLSTDGSGVLSWASGGNVSTSANNAFTGANTFYNATGQTFGTATAAQDGIILAGRAGGTSTYRVTLRPGSLSSNTTLTLPGVTSTVAVLGIAQAWTGLQTFTSGISATGGTTLTLPNVTDTLATIGTAQTFTAAQTFRAANAIRSEAASTQDAVVIAGRAGGTGSFAVTLTPATLSSSTTLTLPNVTDTVATIGTAQTFTAAQTFRAANAIRSEAASTQDAVVIAGRAGGTSSYAATLTPATLSANRTVTIPNETFTIGFRNLPAVGTQTGSYTLGVNDVGKYVQISTGGSITIPTSTFAEGDAITLYNNTTGNITITCSAPTAYIAGTNTVKTSMTLATRGVATILFYSATACVVSGNVS